MANNLLAGLRQVWFGIMSPDGSFTPVGELSPSLSQQPSTENAPSLSGDHAKITAITLVRELDRLRYSQMDQLMDLEEEHARIEYENRLHRDRVRFDLDVAFHRAEYEAHQTLCDRYGLTPEEAAELLRQARNEL